MPGLSKEPGQLVVHQALDLDEVPRKALRFRHELCDSAFSQEHISIQCHGPFCATLKPDLVSPAKSCFKWSLVDDLHGIPTDLHPQQLPADLQCTLTRRSDDDNEIGGSHVCNKGLFKGCGSGPYGRLWSSWLAMPFFATEGSQARQGA